MRRQIDTYPFGVCYNEPMKKIIKFLTYIEENDAALTLLTLVVIYFVGILYTDIGIDGIGIYTMVFVVLWWMVVMFFLIPVGLAVMFLRIVAELIESFSRLVREA